MLSLTKMENNMYSVFWLETPLFYGKYTETLAFIHWSHGIDKEIVKKSLMQLININEKIIFEVKNDYMDR